MLVRGVSETPQTIEAITVAFGCFPEVEGKFLLLKIPCTSDIGLGGSELDLTWKPHPRGLALIVPESATQAAEGEKQPIVLLCCEASESQQGPCQDIPKDAVASLT